MPLMGQPTNLFDLNAVKNNATQSQWRDLMPKHRVSKRVAEVVEVNSSVNSINVSWSIQAYSFP